ncbi:MAG: type III-B CRISPR module-associated protein Cmr5 [Synergistaceae bacterium]|nr:type III-B CRISPR module-associated protein Cmr5 [Synergistaceae bacterium]
MPIITNEQKMSQEAFARISERSTQDSFKEYKSFALSFPSMIHTCGLVQAVSFAQAKKRKDYLEDINAVFAKADSSCPLETESRRAELNDYMRMTLHALSAASWLKRYCQATGGGDD